MLKITAKEIENVLKLDAYSRYKYSIKRIADTNLIYFLIEDTGKFALSEIEGKILFPVWSAKEYAELNRINVWVKYSILEMRLGEFITDIIPILKSKDYLLSIFAANGKTGFVVEVEELIRDLNAELENYE